MVCGQCHVEDHRGPKVTLFFPWQKGFKVEQIEATYDEYKFPDGHRFFDWQHKRTGAEVLKVGPTRSLKCGVRAFTRAPAFRALIAHAGTNA